MKKISVAVVGFGNIGKACVKTVQEAPDMVLAGVVRRTGSLKNKESALENICVVDDIQKLDTPVDVVLLCAPTREVPAQSHLYRSMGYNTVDSFDDHEKLLAYRQESDIDAKATKTVSVIASGWDPGTDSVLRVVMAIVDPLNKTTTTFGGEKGGRSMGHTAFVKSLPGVKDAVALTLAASRGKHKRLVYMSLLPGADIEDIKRRMFDDFYFKYDPTEIKVVDDIAPFNTLHHEGDVEATSADIKQRYVLSGINPLMAGNVMVAAARAVYRAAEQKAYGSYTLLERPLIDFIPGETLADKLHSY